MTEKSEQQASETGQDKETPETEAAPAPETGSEETQETANPLYTEGDETPSAQEQQAASPYSEGDHHVPDPTAMSGTLETSGTGGGANETLRGTTGVFEEAGLPSYRSTDVVSGDNTGQPEPTSAGAEPTSYQETTIAGAAPGPREGESEGPFTTATKPAEGSETEPGSQETGEDQKDAQEPAEAPEETKAPAKQSAAAKKTAAKKTTASRTQSKS